MPGRSGFTLIEVMLAAGLAAVIASAALAPLVFTVRSLGEAQMRYGAAHSVPAAAEKIFHDARGTLFNPTFPTFKVIRRSGLSREDDDRLLIWGRMQGPAGEVTGVTVYKIAGQDKAGAGKPGLYRWLLADGASTETSGDISYRTDGGSPVDIDTDLLDESEATLILHDAAGLRFMVCGEGKDWQEEYEGALPSALRAELTVDGKKHSYTGRFPNAAEK
ncbi:MAG: prepilin-type N-terminal cleavage/methylation domain-containing protein [Synergistes sp.]|nr:prepilin-type N-terminal cleavage/methylation domain-containing protein [Synergistes sp.]